jgi:hypothetical protein
MHWLLLAEIQRIEGCNQDYTQVGVCVCVQVSAHWSLLWLPKSKSQHALTRIHTNTAHSSVRDSVRSGVCV